MVVSPFRISSVSVEVEAVSSARTNDTKVKSIRKRKSAVIFIFIKLFQFPQDDIPILKCIRRNTDRRFNAVYGINQIFPAPLMERSDIGDEKSKARIFFSFKQYRF